MFQWGFIHQIMVFAELGPEQMTLSDGEVGAHVILIAFEYKLQWTMKTVRSLQHTKM